MSPLQRLNALEASLDLGAVAGRAQILSWNYRSHLPDNLPHRHTFFEVCTIGSHGEGEFRVEGASHKIQAGTTFIARPGIIHQIVNTTHPEMELFWVCFALDGHGDLARAFIGSDVLTVQDPCVPTLWSTLFNLTASPFPGSSAVLVSLAQALLLAILGTGSDLPAPDVQLPPDFRAHQVKLAVRFIHDNLSHPLSLAEIAAHTHVSPRQLTRLFALFVGTSPANYIEVARLDRAEALLLKSSLSLKEIAREVGYEDAAHFSRVFSKRNGNPPGDFRKRGGPLIVRPSGPNIQRLGALV